MTKLNDIYAIAEIMNIEVFSFGLSATESLSTMDSNGDCYIAIDPMILGSEQEEKMKLIHELSHCVKGAFYFRHTPKRTREIYEARAKHWAIKQLVPRQGLAEAAKYGITEVWELAEYFEVPEEFIHQAFAYYQDLR